MGECSFKYGNDKLNTFIKDEQVIQILKPQQVEKIKNIEDEVYRVLDNPIGSMPLKDIVKPGEKIAIIVSDITRSWMKSNKLVIYIVNYLSKLGVEDEDMFVVIALGGHRKSTKEEMIAVVG